MPRPSASVFHSRGASSPGPGWSDQTIQHVNALEAPLSQHIFEQWGTLRTPSWRAWHSNTQPRFWATGCQARTPRANLPRLRKLKMAQSEIVRHGSDIRAAASHVARDRPSQQRKSEKRPRRNILLFRPQLLHHIQAGVVAGGGLRAAGAPSQSVTPSTWKLKDQCFG